MIPVDRELVDPVAVGASQLGAILGCDPFTTPLQLWRRKRGLDEPQPDNERMALGRALERPLVDILRQRIPLRIRRNRTTYLHSASSALFATPDAFVGRDRLLEVKVVGLRSPDAYADELPCRVRLQVQGQLAVTGRAACYVAQLIGSELRLTTVERDELVIAEVLEAAAAFCDLLDSGSPPDPLTWDERWSALLALLVDAPRRDVLATQSVQELGDELIKARRAGEQLEDGIKLARLALLDALYVGEGDRIVANGWTATLAETQHGPTLVVRESK